jgi:hypothetical protein
MFRANAHHSHGSRQVSYDPREVDFIAVYVVPDSMWYVIPVRALLGRIQILLRQRNDPKPSRYDRYFEAWHLLGGRDPDENGIESGVKKPRRYLGTTAKRSTPNQRAPKTRNRHVAGRRRVLSL